MTIEDAFQLMSLGMVTGVAMGLFFYFLGWGYGQAIKLFHHFKNA